MAMKIGAQQDFDQIPVIGLVFEPSDTPPADPVNGRAWQDTLNGRFMYYLDGWKEVALVGEHTHDVSEVNNLASGVLEPLQEAVATHTADTTDVHGIPNTALLETMAGAQAKVDAAIAALKGGAPETMDTLNEISAALNEDQGVIDTLLSQIGTKANDADLATVAKSGAYLDLSGRPTLAAVATSGSYTDLLGTPVTPTYSDDGALLPVRGNVNFTGLGVTAYDDPEGTGQTVVAIPGASAMTWTGTAYTARPVSGVPGTFIGPVSPYDLGLMIDGDTWINTTADPLTEISYLSTANYEALIATKTGESGSPIRAAVDARVSAGLATLPAAIDPWTKTLDIPGTGVPLSAMDLTAASGTWNATGSYIEQTNTAGPFRARVNTFQPLGAAYVFEADVMIASGSGADQRAGLVVGFDGTNSGGANMRLHINGSTPDMVQVEVESSSARLNVTATEWVTNPTFGGYGKWVRMRMVSNGQLVSAYLNGTLLGTAGNNVQGSNNATYVGFMTGGCVARFRNIRAWASTLPQA